MTDVHDRATRSFRPGDWFGIFGPHATVLLPPSEKGRVAALWELVDDGAGFDETLDALVATGLRGLPGFVLVSAAGDETEFITIIFWDSIEAVKAVAGADYETAVVPEERRQHLSRYDTRAAHYEVVSSRQPAG